MKTSDLLGAHKRDRKWVWWLVINELQDLLIYIRCWGIHEGALMPTKPLILVRPTWGRPTYYLIFCCLEERPTRWMWLLSQHRDWVTLFNERNIKPIWIIIFFNHLNFLLKQNAFSWGSWASIGVIEFLLRGNSSRSCPKFQQGGSNIYFSWVWLFEVCKQNNNTR